jgi:hypothetical protein
MKGMFTAVIAGIIFFIAACAKEKGGGGGGTNNPPFVPNCNGAATSFSTNVLTIFQTVCSQNNCHNSGSVNGPGPLTNYAEINAARGNIRAAIISGFMPKNTTLSAAQKNSIICWIDAGAQNN